MLARASLPKQLNPIHFALKNTQASSAATPSASIIHITPPQRKSSMPQRIIALLLSLVATFAHAEIIDLTWSPDNTFKHVSTVAPKKFVEVCGDLSEASHISWQLTSAHNVDFNIHRHSGKKVIYAENRKAIREGTGVLQVKPTDNYCWMLKNMTDTPAEVELALKKLKRNEATGNYE